jgi:DNA-binding MarR family transcriptional regulator
VSPVLKRLQSAGLIERHRDTADERTLRLTLTPRGRELKQQASRIPYAMMEQLGMSIEELESLRERLVHLIDRAEAAGVHPDAAVSV